MVAKPVFGIDWNEIAEFYQPSCSEFAQSVADARREKINLREIIPIPDSWEILYEKQLKAQLPRNQISRFRRIYGYLVTAQSTDSDGTLTPVIFQLATKLNFRYGISDREYADSHIWCRVQAYSSLAALSLAVKPWKLGDIVCGIVERTSKEMNTARLVGWDIVGFDEWRLMTLI